MAHRDSAVQRGLKTLAGGTLVYVLMLVPVVLTAFYAARNVGDASRGALVFALLLFGLPAALWAAHRKVRAQGLRWLIDRLIQWLVVLAQCLFIFVVFFFLLSRQAQWPLWALLLAELGFAYLFLFERAPKRRLIYTARYATEDDVAGLKVDLGDPAARHTFLLGVNWHSLLGLRPGVGGRRELGHQLVVAPTRGGKGRNLTANLLNWGESAVILDIKGENYHATAGYRSGLGAVVALDPRGRGHRYDPFAELRHSDEALLTAAKLLVEDPADQDPAFAERAASGVYAALLAAQLEGAPTLPFLDRLLGEGLDGFVEGLTVYEDPKVDRALTRFLGYRASGFSVERAAGDRFLSSSWTLLNSRVAPLLTEGVLAMTGGHDVSARDLYAEPTSLYLIFPETESEATGKVFKLIVTSLMLGLMRAYDDAPAPPSRPVLMLLDEVGRTPIPKLSDYLSTLAGRNVSVALYLQSLAQLEAVYGEAAAQTVLDNCRTQIFYPTPNVRTQHYVSQLGGVMQYDEVSTSQGTSASPGGAGDWFGQESYTESVTVRLGKVELIQPATLRTMHPDSTWVFTADLPPLAAWRLDPSFLPTSVLEQAQLAAPSLEPLSAPALPEARVPGGSAQTVADMPALLDES